MEATVRVTAEEKRKIAALEERLAAAIQASWPSACENARYCVLPQETRLNIQFTQPRFDLFVEAFFQSHGYNTLICTLCNDHNASGMLTIQYVAAEAGPADISVEHSDRRLVAEGPKYGRSAAAPR